HTEKEVFTLVEKRWKGLQRLRTNLGDENIGYEEHGGYEIFTAKQNELYEQCTERMSGFNETMKDITGIKEVYWTADERISEFGFDGVSHMLFNCAEGQVNTGQMMNVLLNKVRALGVNIINGFPVKNFSEQENHVDIIADNGLNIKAKKLLIATNGFAQQLVPELDVTPARAQVLITKPISGLKWKGIFHYDEGYYYFRNVGDRVLIGGGRNLDFEGEATTEFGLTEQIQNRLEQMLRKIFLPENNFKVDMRWSGIMGLGDKKITIVRHLSPHIFCSVRMGGMGIAIGSLIGEEAAEMISENS
ncbi:MAG: FAD-binding oxidoreductase, partial [Bacteroidia bacterium]|nr:FAD-binding oxidoreductase [Bacteroidia bacterium]